MKRETDDEWIKAIFEWSQVALAQGFPPAQVPEFVAARISELAKTERDELNGQLALFFTADAAIPMPLN